MPGRNERKRNLEVNAMRCDAHRSDPGTHPVYRGTK